MFSYRHAFHAGNHADVLKHATLIAILNHMLEKDAALMVVDTHAGAGLYRLDGDYAQTSGEAIEGIKKLMAVKSINTSARAGIQTSQFVIITVGQVRVQNVRSSEARVHDHEAPRSIQRSAIR